MHFGTGGTVAELARAPHISPTCVTLTSGPICFLSHVKVCTYFVQEERKMKPYAQKQDSTEKGEKRLILQERNLINTTSAR